MLKIVIWLLLCIPCLHAMESNITNASQAELDELAGFLATVIPNATGPEGTPPPSPVTTTAILETTTNIAAEGTPITSPVTTPIESRCQSGRNSTCKSPFTRTQ